jgi:hypothetical protein
MRVYAGATHELTASQDVTGKCVTEECGWKPVFPYSTAIHGNRNDFWRALSLFLGTALVFILVLQREQHNIGAQIAVDKKSAIGAVSAESLRKKRISLARRKYPFFRHPAAKKNGAKRKMLQLQGPFSVLWLISKHNAFF